MKKLATASESITELLESRAKKSPDKIAVICDGQNFNYVYLDIEANRFAHWLRQVGIEPGARVVFNGSNSVSSILALFGTLKAGATFVPIHPQTPPHKLTYIVKDCTPQIIVTDHSFVINDTDLQLQSVKRILLAPDCSIKNTPITCGEAVVEPWEILSGFPDFPPTVNSLSESIAIIIYTSGSTKDPKGVMLPHRQVMFATSAINKVLGNGPEDIILCGLPISFDYGLYQILLIFQVGGQLVLEKNFSIPMSIPKLLALYDVTGFPGVPSLFAMLLRSRLLERVELPKLRYLTSTGDIFPSSHVKKLRALLPHVTIFPMYGLTECKRVSIVPKGKLDGHENSVGLPIPGTKASVVDQNGQLVPAGTIGELVVWGPHIMAGYWNSPEETAHRFRRDPSTGEVVLYTGDYFRVDEEGFLYFIGRNEMLIKSRGERISPAEIESCICSKDGVAESAAVGVPDEMLGESVWAFVSLIKPGIVSELDILKHCRRDLSQAAWPSRIIMLDSPLPRTTNDKIDREKLRTTAKRIVSAEGVNDN